MIVFENGAMAAAGDSILKNYANSGTRGDVNGSGIMTASHIRARTLTCV